MMMPPKDIIQGTPAVICGIAPDGSTTFINPGGEAITGYRAEELIGKNWWSLFFPGDEYRQVEQLFRDFEKVEVRDYEMTLTTRDGSKRIILWNFLLTRDRNGSIIHTFSFGNDITERKRREMELCQLSRTLKALSQSNATMIRATSEQELLQAVCNIVVEDCGHAMVWIGFREEDEARTVRPVAHAGLERGYLETLQVTWSDTERGLGPTGRAIRTGRPCQCQDMRTDADFAPWREQALRRGYASALVLPLLADGVAFGAVTIYSGQPAAFSEDEVKLLTELANDLAFGISAMRLRAANAQAEGALRESEQRYRSLFEHMLDGFAYCRMLYENGSPQDFTYLDVNDAFERLTGLKNVVGKKVSEVIPGIQQSAPELLRIYGRVALSGQPERFEIYLEALGIWFSISVYSPRKEHFIAVFDNITVRKKAEETLSFLARYGLNPDEDFFKALARYLGETLGMDFVCIDRLMGEGLTAQTEAMFVNGKFENNISYALEDTPCGAVVGKTVCCFPTGVRHLFPRDAVLQDMGAESYVGVTLWGHAGQPIGLIAVIGRRPLANPRLAESVLKLVASRAAGELERKRSEEDLRKAKDELAQANANLEGMVKERTAKLQETIAELEYYSYTITHDMRAPLRAMSGYGQMLLEESQSLSPACKEFIERINTAARRMDQLILDSLDYNKLVRHQFVLTPVDCEALLRGMLETYPQYHASKARISIAGNIPAVLANEAGLTQCFSNLLDNAIKFVQPGQTPEIQILAEDKGDQLRIWFQDNGIGIREDCHKRIFLVFQRIDPAYEGTGIGLALVRKAAQRMGGAVGVESEPGKGSRFWLEFKKPQ